MSRFTVLPLALLVSLLAACATGPARELTESGQLHLIRPLPIEADAASVRLQYGRIVARNAVQEHDPFCIFEIETVHEQVHTVAPGQFDIMGIARSIETIARLPMHSPSGWVIRKVGFGDDDSPTHIYFKTAFRLRDAGQSVRALTCMSNQNAPGNAHFMRHLTMDEIRATLGTWFELHLKR